MQAASRWTLRVGCQSAHGMRAVLAQVMGIEPARLRVVVPDTGGGFGARGGVYPEFPLLLVAARRLGRPVKWTAGRAESFLTDHQARDHVLRGELALDAEGRFTAIRVAVDWRHGAYLTTRNVWVMVHYLPPTLGGPYRIPCGHVSIRGLFSHTTPLAAFRGIGRIEANYLTESLIEAAAREAGIDRIELRRRNMVGDGALPWTTPGGAVLTSGAFRENLDRALALADWAGFSARREGSRARGLLRGFGLAMYVENDGSTPAEFAEIQATADGRVIVSAGTQDFGMGHDTVFSQVAAETLGVPFEQVEVVFGDTDRVARGAGSHGSRSARIGGGAVVASARKMIDEGRTLAARMLEAAAADVTYAGGRFTVAGTDRGVGLFEVAAFAERGRGGLSAEADFVTAGDVHANGCHAAEVTVDPEDGTVRLERHVDRGGRRPGHQPADRPRPDARRRRPGRRAGADGARRVRGGQRAAAVRELHGLRHPAGRRPAVLHRRAQRADRGRQPARRQGSGRECDHRRPGRADERGPRRPRRRRRRRCRHAGHARAGVAGAVHRPPPCLRRYLMAATSVRIFAGSTVKMRTSMRWWLSNDVWVP